MQVFFLLFRARAVKNIQSRSRPKRGRRRYPEPDLKDIILYRKMCLSGDDKEPFPYEMYNLK